MNNYLKKVTKSPNIQQKQLVREYLMNFFSEYNILHGLAGPHINTYIQWAIKHKFSNINIYEKDESILMCQIGSIKSKIPISLKLGDINNVVPKEKEFYDLDYCCTILNMENAIKKFNKDFIMTFSRRLVGNKTIDRFFEIREEIVNLKKNLLFPVEHTVYTTNKGNYIYAPYWDTSAMCCIAKIN